LTFRAGDVGGDLDRVAGLGRMVEGDRIVAVEGDVRFGAMGCREAADDLLEARFGKRANLLVERAHRAGDRRLVRDDVVGKAGIELGDGDHDRAQADRHCATRSSAGW
jgi:hypothetical protein